MFSHYKGLLLTGSSRTANQIKRTQEEAQRRKAEAEAAALKLQQQQQQQRGSPLSTKIYINNQPPVEIFFGSDTEEDDFSLEDVEDAQEVDETFRPEDYEEEEEELVEQVANVQEVERIEQVEEIAVLVEEKQEVAIEEETIEESNDEVGELVELPPTEPVEDIGSLEMYGTPIPRSKPVPIRQRPKMLYPFGIEETNVYIGSYRNLNQFDLLKHELCDILTAGYTNIYVDIKAKAKKLTRAALCMELVPIVLQDGCTFFYDVETTTLMPEEDLFDFLADFCIKEYENEVCDRKSVALEQCFLDLMAAYPLKFFPSEKSQGFDMGYPLEPEEPPVESHKFYTHCRALFDAKTRALEHKIQNIELELNKGSDMSIVSINRLIRFFSDEFNFLPMSVKSTSSTDTDDSMWPPSPVPTPSPQEVVVAPPTPPIKSTYFSYICTAQSISL